jgi:hypothetical protein
VGVVARFRYKATLVVGAYHLLTHLTSKELPIYCDLVWNMFVPLKVSSFAWYFVNDTKSNLSIRMCLRNDSHL